MRGRHRLGRVILEPIQLSRGELELTHQQRGMDMKSGNQDSFTSEHPISPLSHPIRHIVWTIETELWLLDRPAVSPSPWGATPIFHLSNDQATCNRPSTPSSRWEWEARDRPTLQTSRMPSKDTSNIPQDSMPIPLCLRA